MVSKKTFTAILLVGFFMITSPITAEKVTIDETDVPYIVAPEGPPPPFNEEEALNSPSPNYVWIPGHWAWNGKWDWVKGHWRIPPHEKSVWVPGHWEKRDHGWIWIHGHWS